MMKQFFLFALAAIFGLQAQAQTQKQKVNVSEIQAVATTKAENYAELTFDTLRHDFGKFSKDEPLVHCAFAFTNTGTAPLIIHQAFASCGCTIPTYTKEPIKPGEKGEIKVTYNGTGKFPGHFKKSITVRTNGAVEMTRLYIEGDMTEAK